MEDLTLEFEMRYEKANTGELLEFTLASRSLILLSRHNVENHAKAICRMSL